MYNYVNKRTIIRGLRGDVAFDLSLDVWKEFQSVERKRDFPGSSDSKASACNVGDLGSILGLGRSPGGGHGKPLQYSYLENPHGQRNLAHYNP